MILMRTLTGVLILAWTSAAQAGDARLPDGFWLFGDFTQNVRCKGNGSDPAEVKVKVAPDQIVSKVGVSKFITTTGMSRTTSISSGVSGIALLSLQGCSRLSDVNGRLAHRGLAYQALRTLSQQVCCLSARVALSA